MTYPPFTAGTRGLGYRCTNDLGQTVEKTTKTSRVTAMPRVGAIWKLVPVAAEPAKKILLVVEGNSIPAGRGTTGGPSAIGSETDQAWPDQVQAILGAGAIEVHNLAQSNSTHTTMAFRRQAVLDVFHNSSASEFSRRIFFLYEYTNNAWHIGGATGENCVTALGEYVNDTKKAGLPADVEVWTGTPLPFNGSDQSADENKRVNDILDIARGILTGTTTSFPTGTRYATTYFDKVLNFTTCPIFKDQAAAANKTNFFDGIHPANPGAYELAQGFVQGLASSARLVSVTSSKATTAPVTPAPTTPTTIPATPSAPSTTELAQQLSGLQKQVASLQAAAGIPTSAPFTLASVGASLLWWLDMSDPDMRKTTTKGYSLLTKGAVQAEFTFPDPANPTALPTVVEGGLRFNNSPLASTTALPIPPGFLLVFIVKDAPDDQSAQLVNMSGGLVLTTSPEGIAGFLFPNGKVSQKRQNGAAVNGYFFSREEATQRLRLSQNGETPGLSFDVPASTIPSAVVSIGGQRLSTGAIYQGFTGTVQHIFMLSTMELPTLRKLEGLAHAQQGMPLPDTHAYAKVAPAVEDIQAVVTATIYE